MRDQKGGSRIMYPGHELNAFPGFSPSLQDLLNGLGVEPGVVLITYSNAANNG
jgi:hypothetical protein